LRHLGHLDAPGNRRCDAERAHAFCRGRGGSMHLLALRIDAVACAAKLLPQLLFASTLQR